MNAIFKRKAVFILNVYGGNTGLIPKVNIKFPKKIVKKIGGNISMFLNKKIEDYAQNTFSIPEQDYLLTIKSLFHKANDKFSEYIQMNQNGKVVYLEENNHTLPTSYFDPKLEKKVDLLKRAESKLLL